MTRIAPQQQPHHTASHRIHRSARYAFRSCRAREKHYALQSMLQMETWEYFSLTPTKNMVFTVFNRQDAFQSFCHTDKRITHGSRQSQVSGHHLEMMTRFESSLHNPTIQEQTRGVFCTSKKKSLYIQGEISKQTWQKGQMTPDRYFSQNVWLHFLKYWGYEQMLSNKPTVSQNYVVKLDPHHRVDAFTKEKGVFCKIRVSVTVSLGDTPNQV